MGRATIVSGGTDGRYVIELDYGRADRDARIAKLTELIADLTDRRNFQQGLLDQYTGAMQSILDEMNALIVQYVELSKAVPINPQALDAKRKEIDKITATLVRQQLVIQDLQAAVDGTTASIAAAERERADLWNAEIVERRPAWCTDFTENGEGTVATIDVPGESSLILIAPGARAPVAMDGALSARELQRPDQVFWNAAVLPGWQKWKPMYRTGVITALDEKTDTCAVSLDYATSTARALEINQSAALSNVPIVYMDCNAEAFKVNDRVVVQFEGMNWSAPKVIGFVDNPRACGVWLRYHYPDTSSSPFSEHAYKVPKGKDGPKVTPPEFHGQERFWRWDDGVSSLQRQEKKVQAAKSVAAQYVSMPLLYLQVRTLQTGWEFGLPGGTTRVGLQLSPIVDAAYPGGHYYFAHEVLEETFPTRAQAEAWRPSPVAVHRWVPAVNRTFVMSYTYSSGLDRWVPPGDFASGSFVGQDTPPWP